MKTEQLEFNGTALVYDAAGLGTSEPLVFIHAGIADRRMWDKQFTFFADRFRVHRYDVRGFGETAVSPNDYAYVDDLHALFEHWGIGAAHLVGCSMGGTIALDFTLAHLDRVKSLTMVCSAPSGYPFASEDSPPAWDEIVAAYRAGDIEKTNELEATFWVDGTRKAAPERNAMRQQVLEMNGIALENQVNGNSGERQEPEIKAYEQFDKLTAPLLVITGRFDEPQTAKAGAFMVENHAGAETAVFDAAHLPNMEHPDAFNERLLSFLQNVG